MNKRKIYLFSGFVIIIFLIWIQISSTAKSEDESEIVKISLRDVGHQLLLSNQDSTSLVLPIKILNKEKFEISFANNLSFEPGNLVTIIQQSFEKAALSEHYRVEVIQCSDNEDEVAYSYEMNHTKEKAIIPCRGRLLPNECYTIEIRFIDNKASIVGVKPLLSFLLLGIFVLLYFDSKKRKQVAVSEDHNSTCNSIGSFQFYPAQNKLVRKSMEISLSKKECELLEIFVANPNQIIKRDELTKRVWEDHGVFVGRSLDTYISKLRKKLQDDTSIKLTNIHGVGYKLEIE